MYSIIKINMYIRRFTQPFAVLTHKPIIQSTCKPLQTTYSNLCRHPPCHHRQLHLPRQCPALRRDVGPDCWVRPRRLTDPFDLIQLIWTRLFLTVSAQFLIVFGRCIFSHNWFLYTSMFAEYDMVNVSPWITICSGLKLMRFA